MQFVHMFFAGQFVIGTALECAADSVDWNWYMNRIATAVIHL